MKLFFFSYSSYNYAALTLGGLLLIATARPGPACSLCGCSLCSDWTAQGDSTAIGSEFSLRYEYADQSQLLSGTKNVDRNTIPLPNDQEIQQKTINRATWLTAQYALKNDWSLGLELPYYDRFHTTIAPGDTDISTSRANGFGDARILERYQDSNPAGGWGAELGLKLPTGRFNQTFENGPQTGNILDRGLQLGTGTTDWILGLSYFGRVGDRIGYFGQAVVQRAIAERSSFLPSSSLVVSTGLRWLNTTRFLPQIQINARWDGREKGPNADFENSGASIIDVSPGVTAELTRHSSAFAFLQLPVYERVNGYQLEPHWLVSLGVRYHL